jgi:ATP-dependent Clp protease ATP-binding subunit ClpB
MRIDRFTNQLQSVLSDAQSLAVGRDNNVIDPLHILCAMLDQQGGSIAPLLTQAGANVQEIRPQLQQALDALPTVQGAGGDVHMSNDMSRVLNVADKISQQNKDAYISSEVVALALLDVNTAAKKVLSDAGVSKQSLESAIAHVRGGETLDDPAAE